MSHTVKHILISMPGMMHEPIAVDSPEYATCEVMVWVKDRQAVVLFVDTGHGASVTNAIDLLIPFVVKKCLSEFRVPWRNVRFFGRDSIGAYDEVVIDQFDGSWACEANWKPMPAGVRTLEGFRRCVQQIDLVVTKRDIELIEKAVSRWAARQKMAA